MEESRCSVCGTVLNPGDSFCQNCGSPVEAPAPAEETTSGVQAETPVAPEVSVTPEQQETTVLSGNPYSVSNDGSQTAPSNAAAGYQTAGTGTGTNYQGSYGTYNTTYNVNYTQPAPAPKKSKALGVVGLILGIIGILTSCCWGGFIFGLIGLILSIVYLVKKGSKGLGVSGIITSALGLLLSLAWLIIFCAMPALADEIMPDEYQDIMDGVSNGGTGDDYTSSGSTSISGTNQILINDSDLYTLPVSLSSMGLTVSDEDSDVVSDIETNGMYPGDYEFVLLNSSNGYSFWGYIENTGSDTVYSVDDLQVTGINVDNYSYACSAYSAEVYGGITLNMSRTEVESIIGACDYQDDNGLDVYESDSGSEVLRLEYEGDYVSAIDITIY